MNGSKEGPQFGPETKDKKAALTRREFSSTSKSVGYTPPPPLAESDVSRRRWKPWFATTGIFVIAAALTFAVVTPQVGDLMQPATVSGLQTENRLLQVGAAEIDREATEYARQLIAADGFWATESDRVEELPGGGGGLSEADVMAPIINPEREAGTPTLGASKDEAETPADQGARPTTQAGALADNAQTAGSRVPVAAVPADGTQLSDARKEAVRSLVASAPREDLQRIAAGQQMIYRVRLIDTVEEDGDEVDLYINNVAYGVVPLSHVGAELVITLPQNTPAEVRVVARADGGGGVTFGAKTSEGEVRTRVMQVGESDSWTVAAR